MIRTFIKKIMHQIRSIFLNGLLTILPIAITFVILKIFFSILSGWLEPIYELEPQILRKIPGSEIFLALLFIFIVGVILKFFLLEPFVHVLENMLNKIPLLRPIYFGVKQMVHAFTAPDTPMFQRVVLVEFPRKNIYSIGFLTSDLPPELSPTVQQTLYSVYVPTTPNPTTGFFLCVPEGDFIEANLTRQEAMALIISGGIIQPERFAKRHQR